MIALNHALTGAVIGLTVTNPWLALPLAFVSHLALDAIPHYDFPGDELARIRSKGFLYFQILGNAVLCFGVVLALGIAQPAHWLLGATCAFVAAMPDMFKIGKFLHATRHNTLIQGNWFNRLHHDIQWKVGPGLWWTETIWCALFTSLLIARL